MKYIIGILCCIIVTGCSIGNIQQENTNAVDMPKVCFAQKCYHIEIADEPDERQQGLMRRETMEKQAGMLFVFSNEAPNRTFWMKNTLIPLDMIWLDKTYTIVHIETDVPPCTTPTCPSYGPSTQLSQYVIELNAGEVAGLSSALGDKVSIFNTRNEVVPGK